VQGAFRAAVVSGVGSDCSSCIVSLKPEGWWSWQQLLDEEARAGTAGISGDRGLSGQQW
jgi:hypothetical protein